MSYGPCLKQEYHSYQQTIIMIRHVFQCNNIRQVSREMLKNPGFSLGFFIGFFIGQTGRSVEYLACADNDEKPCLIPRLLQGSGNCNALNMKLDQAIK